MEPGEILGFSFNNPSLLKEALTHSSYAHESGKPSNKRLAFLGDNLLSLVLACELYHFSPSLSVGRMSRLLSHLISASTLSQIASSINLGERIYLGKGEEKSGGRKRPSILAEALEAVLGAIFLDGGLERAKEVILRLFDKEWQKIAQGRFPVDYKSLS